MVGCSHKQSQDDLILLKALVSNDIVAIEIYTEDGEMIKRIDSKEGMKSIKNWLNSSYSPVAIGSYYDPVLEMKFLYKRKHSSKIMFGGDKRYSTIKFLKNLYLANPLPNVLAETIFPLKNKK
jgi:hypothetical protein